MPATTTSVLARRIARITFGSVMLAGAAVLVAGALRRPFDLFGSGAGSGDEPSLHAQRILAITWAVALGCAGLAWVVCRLLRLRGNPDRFLTKSLVVPAIGLAFLLPITLHALVFVAFRETFPFDEWVAISVRITGAAHIVFAIACAMRAHRLAAGRPAISPGAIYLLTVATSCVPFMLLLAIPPILVAITALPCWPLLRYMERIVNRERDALVGAPHVLPRAIARMD